MKYSVEPERCALCDEGTAHPTHSVEELDPGVVCILEFSRCDTCGSEYASGLQININAKRAKEARACAQS